MRDVHVLTFITQFYHKNMFSTIQECEEELLKDQILLRSFVTLSEDTTMTTTINWKEHGFVVKYAKKVSVA